MTAINEHDIIDPVPDTYQLSSGLVIGIEDLKTRQFFRLVRILTHGAPNYLDQGIMSVFAGESEDMVEQLITMILFSIPEAEDQTMDFLASMVKPLDLHQPARTKAEKAENLEKWARVESALLNPALEDTVGIVSAIISRESGNLKSLGNQLMSMIEKHLPKKEVSAEIGSEETSETSTLTDSSEDSAKPSTSSSQSTDGVTERSLDSLLEDSVK
jgi:hypothetical protein